MNFISSRISIGIVGLVFSCGMALAGSPIEVTIDFGEGSYDSQASANRKSVVIDSISIDRKQPVASGDEVTIDPEYSNNQIGWINYRGSEHIVVLKNMTLERFVREAVTLGFQQSGHGVVDSAVSGDAVVHVDVAVRELWMWQEPIEGTQRKQFHFAMATEITSNTDGIPDMGLIQVADFRNGSRATSWKSYRNTMMHSMKAYLVNFTDRVKKIEATVAPAAAGKSSQPDAGTSILTEELRKLEELHDSGVLTDEEYKELRSKAIEAYL